MVETENGYIGYILSYEPDVDWYNGILEETGYFYFDINTFQGHITKYSLEREMIWSTNNESTTKLSKSTMAKTGGSGNFVQVCITTAPEPCLEGRHNDSTGWDDCAYSDGHWREACESVWVSGGAHHQDNPDYEGDGGGGSTTNGGSCTNTSGTSIVNSQPISGISTGCAPNNTVGFDIAAAYTAFWMDLVFAQQNYLNLYPDIKTSVLKYLYNSKYAPQAQKIAKDLINKTNMSLIKNGLFVEAIAVFNFLSLNDWSYEDQLFAKEAIDALIAGGEVDFDNEIIKDPSFVGTKADCVLKALIASGNNLFKKTSQAFTRDKSKFKLKFTAYNNPNGIADARASLPDSKGIIEIRFNLATMNTSSMSLALSILHETIHAELHRIHLSNNQGPNPLPQNQYNWYNSLWNYYNDEDQNNTATSAEHYYMATYLIDNISAGLREFDEFMHPLEYYKRFAWTGLETYGTTAQIITKSELSNLAALSAIVTSDNHSNPCDN